MPHDVFNYVQIGTIYHGIKFLNSCFCIHFQYKFLFLLVKKIFMAKCLVSLTSDKSNTTIVVFASKGAVVVLILIAWGLDLQLHMQSVSIITNVASSNPTHGEVYSIQYCDEVFQ